MASTLGLKGGAIVIVAIFLGAGFVGAQAPSIQDAFKGTVLDCPSVLDEPFSMKTPPGYLRPGVVRVDWDGDQKWDSDEILAGSDPTWDQSTPDDRDADGVKRTEDPCDFDPRVPSVSITLELECGDCAAGAAATRVDNTLALSAVFQVPETIPPLFVDPDGAATCAVDYEGFGAATDETISLGMVSLGHWTATRPLLVGDFAGTWAVTCSATFSTHTKQSNEAKIAVAPTTFAVDVAFAGRTQLFDNEMITIAGSPQAGRFRNAATLPDATVSATTANGVPIPGIHGKKITWNDATDRWVGTFPTDQIPDDDAGAGDEVEKAGFAGVWTIRVDAVDGAPGKPNTGTGASNVQSTSTPLHTITLSAPTAVGRGDAILYTAAYEFRDAPAVADSVTLDIAKPDGTTLSVSMVAGATGDYTFSQPTTIGSPSGTWTATATADFLGVDTVSEEIKTKVNKKTVDLFVAVKQPTYKGAALSPPPSAAGTPAEIAGAAVEFGETPTQQGDEVTIIAVPLGTEGTHFFNDGAPPSQPGEAEFTLTLEGVVPVARLPAAMTWVPNSDADHTAPHFVAKFFVQITDPYGSYQVDVHYDDDARAAPNVGDGSDTFQILNPAQVPLPPKVAITKINTANAGENPVPVAVEQWLVEGTYETRGGTASQTDVNEVWVRVNAGTARTWVPAALAAGQSAGQGKWTATLASQGTYGLAADGTYDVQAVAILNPMRTAGICDGATLPACEAVGPNGVLGSQAVSASPLPAVDRVLYSSTAVKQVDLNFPDGISTQLLGVLGPDGTTLPEGNPNVLYDGSTHTLKGHIDLPSGIPVTQAGGGKIILHIERVAYDNCANLTVPADVAAPAAPIAPAEHTAENAPEWCLRDRVTTYPGVPGDGFDLLNPPLAGMLSQGTVTPVAAGLDFTFLWDIRDSQDGADPIACYGSDKERGSYLVESPATLVRRTNIHHNSSKDGDYQAIFPQASGGTACGGDVRKDHVREILDDGFDVKTWEMTDFQRPEDRPGFIDSARYWVWAEVKTDSGFTISQTVPKTADDLRLACTAAAGESPAGAATSACLAEATTAKVPLPSEIDGAAIAGSIPGYTGVELRFGAYPKTAITEVSTSTGVGEDRVTALKGTPLFRLRDGREPITFTGTIDNNGNRVDPSSIRVNLYRVELAKCVGGNNKGGQAPAIPNNIWCVVRKESVAVAPSDFTTAYDPAATKAGLQTFHATWTPSALPQPPSPQPQIPASRTWANGTWFVTVSLKTADGDRIENLPPIVDPLDSSGEAVGAYTAWLTNPLSMDIYDHFTTFTSPSTNAKDAPPYVAGQPGVFPFGYGGASLFQQWPTNTLAGLGPLKPLRKVDPNGPLGADCFVGTQLPVCAPPAFSGAPYGSVAGDSLVIEGDSNDFLFQNDLKRVYINVTATGFNVDKRGSEVAGSAEKLFTRSYAIDVSAAPSNPPIPGASMAVTPTMSGSYLENSHWKLTLETQDWPETVGVSAVNMLRILADRFGAESARTNARMGITIALQSASGVNAAPKLSYDIAVDRLTAPDSTFVSATLTNVATTAGAGFADSTSTTAAGALEKTDEGAYILSGNAALQFATNYARGVDLGATATNLQRLTGVEVATSTESQSANMEFFAFDEEGNTIKLGEEETPVNDGLPRSVPVEFPIPIKICPQSPQDAVPDSPDSPACNYSESTAVPPVPSQVKRGAEQYNGLIIYLVPLRAGVNPPFVVVGDPNSPAGWIQPGKTTYGADLQANGKITEWMKRGKNGQQNQTLNHFKFGVEGNVEPTDPRFAASASHSSTLPPQSQFSEWIDVGMDPNCAAAMQSPTAEGIAAACVHPYSPYSPKLEPECDAAIRQSPTPEGVATECVDSDAPLSALDCSVSADPVGCIKANDDWAKCIMRQPLAEDGTCESLLVDSNGPGTPRPAPYSDETLSEAWYLVNANLPIWMQSIREPARTVCVSPQVCRAENWQPPEDPDEPPASDGVFTIPRGYVWDRFASTPTLTIREDDTGVTYDVTSFENVLAQLDDPAHQDFGKLLIPDGNYTLTIHGTDNTESMSSVLDPTLPNDGGRLQDFKFRLENDWDNDGISDIREEWLKARIQGSADVPASKRNMCEDTVYGDCTSDRYHDETSLFPDKRNLFSTELDWDADGLPNLFETAPLPAITTPFFSRESAPISLDLELYFNTDPLFADVPGVPATAACVSPGLNSGPLGDRDRDCVLNVADQDREIFRCPASNPDSDGDGYCLDAEVAAGSSNNDADETPDDTDGDGITNSIDDRVTFLTDVVGSVAPVCVQDGPGTCDGHLVLVTLEQQGIEALYIDASAAGAASTFSIGYSYTGTNPVPQGCNTAERRCEIIGTTTLSAAVDTVAGLLNGKLCIAGVPAPLKGTCEDGHAIIAYMGGVQGIEHFYAEATTSPAGFSIGFHYVGETEPSFCLKKVRPGHCEVAGTKSINDALPLVTDTDGDGATNSAELNTSPRSNPFYKHSTPTNKGGGFPSDWDADQFPNDFELKAQPATNPFQQCSNPNDGPRGWSTTNPRVSCEDTNPVGGVNA